MISSSTSITGSSPRTRRRSSSVAFAAAVAVGLAMCAGVADGFVAGPGAPMPAAPVRGQHARGLSTSTAPVSTPPAVVLAPALSAVGVGPEGPRAEADKPGLKFGCEDSWDCEGTQSCCDFVFFKMCCSEGTAAQEQWVPVPIPVRPNDGYPGYYR